MAGRAWASSRSAGINATVPWVLLALVGGALIGCAGYLWQLPWTSEALVVGQVWTPHIAIVAAIAGVTSLMACLIWAVHVLWARFQNVSWSFESAALAVTGVVLGWLISVGLACVGFIPADAHFVEWTSGGQTVVIRTTVDLKGTSSTTEGRRSGLRVRWEPSTLKRR